jgi:zinc transporter, ZIP family
MTEAAFFGALAASSLGLGAALAIWLKPSHWVVGLTLAFGAGALISAVAYELVLEAFATGTALNIGIGLGLGALAFFIGDLWIDRRGGDNRKQMARPAGEGNALALFLGSLLDGIPESLIIGMTLATGGEVGVAFLAAVLMSNLPEGMASTTGLRKAGWSTGKIGGLWTSVVVLAALSAALGYALTTAMSALSGAFVQAFAAGSLLTMLTDTMMPEAYNEAGRVAGLMTVLGFALAVSLSLLE